MGALRCIYQHNHNTAMTATTATDARGESGDNNDEWEIIRGCVQLRILPTTIMVIIKLNPNQQQW